MTTPVEKDEAVTPQAQVHLTGRNVDIPDHFANRVNAKLAKIERLDPTLTSFHVELLHEPNPRRADRADRIQITERMGKHGDDRCSSSTSDHRG